MDKCLNINVFLAMRCECTYLHLYEKLMKLIAETLMTTLYDEKLIVVELLVLPRMLNLVWLAC